jgi:hypothetical protein
MLRKIREKKIPLFINKVVQGLSKCDVPDSSGWDKSLTKTNEENVSKQQVTRDKNHIELL